MGESDERGTHSVVARVEMGVGAIFRKKNSKQSEKDARFGGTRSKPLAGQLKQYSRAFGLS